MNSAIVVAGTLSCRRRSAVPAPPKAAERPPAPSDPPRRRAETEPPAGWAWTDTGRAPLQSTANRQEPTTSREFSCAALLWSVHFRPPRLASIQISRGAFTRLLRVHQLQPLAGQEEAHHPGAALGFDLRLECRSGDVPEQHVLAQVPHLAADQVARYLGHGPIAAVQLQRGLMERHGEWWREGLRAEQHRDQNPVGRRFFRHRDPILNPDG